LFVPSGATQLQVKARGLIVTACHVTMVISAPAQIRVKMDSVQAQPFPVIHTVRHVMVVTAAKNLVSGSSVESALVGFLVSSVPRSVGRFPLLLILYDFTFVVSLEVVDYVYSQYHKRFHKQSSKEG